MTGYQCQCSVTTGPGQYQVLTYCGLNGHWGCPVRTPPAPDIIVHCHQSSGGAPHTAALVTTAPCQVRTLHFSPADCSLEVARLADLVDPSTRVVALGGAANSCGSTSDIRKAGGGQIFLQYTVKYCPCAVEVVRAASGGAALVCVDAVHLAPHRALDVRTLGCDILACSAYKGHSFMTLHVCRQTRHSWIYTLLKEK